MVTTSQKGVTRAALIVVALITLSVIFYRVFGSDNVTSSTSAGGVFAEREHIVGNRNSDIRVFLYSDTECPYCNSFHDYSLPKLLEEYGNKVAIIYRHFPIVSLHPNAYVEAEALECAYEQKGNEGFWDMLDALYGAIEKENTFDVKALPMLAESIGLDSENLKKCVASGKGRSWVEYSIGQGVERGVYKTPSVYVENVRTGKSTLVNGVGYSASKAAIKLVGEL